MYKKYHVLIKALVFVIIVLVTATITTIMVDSKSDVKKHIQPSPHVAHVQLKLPIVHSPVLKGDWF